MIDSRITKQVVAIYQPKKILILSGRGKLLSAFLKFLNNKETGC